ncbi:glycosyltransferase family 2 protein [Pacificibacter marinus]|nr:glycosyltransferase family 2 protein [Pacificibacter marinus]
MVKISVMLPVYNGADFLELTLASLGEQTTDAFEVLCIDDCSTDNSAEIIKRYEKQDPRFRYINTETNLGSASKSLNFATRFITGSRFVYSSQDDLFSKDWLQKLHDRSMETGADAVLPDVEFFYESSKANRRISGYHGDHSARITGRDAFAASLDWSIPGNALWPVEFLKDQGFYEFNAFSDEYTVRSWFLKSKEVAFCDGVFFYRQDNPNAITKKPSPKRLDEVYTNLMVWRLGKENNFDTSVLGPFALRTFRSLIRAQATIINNPELAGETLRMTQIWDDLQSPAFRTSLEAGVADKKKPLIGMIYLKAHRSLRWFKLLVRLSAATARIKDKRGNKASPTKP